jgi:hypothetical protein
VVVVFFRPKMITTFLPENDTTTTPQQYSTSGRWRVGRSAVGGTRTRRGAARRSSAQTTCSFTVEKGKGQVTHLSLIFSKNKPWLKTLSV